MEMPVDTPDSPTSPGYVADIDEVEAFTQSMLSGRPCETPPPWSPPSFPGCLLEASMAEGLALPPLVLPAEQPPIPTSLSSPSKAPPKKVAIVLNEILPISDSPKRSSSKTSANGNKFQNVVSKMAALSLSSKAFKAKPEQPLMSLSELRRKLLDRWESLQKAFQMLEQKLDNGGGTGPKGLMKSSGGMKRMGKKMSLREFTQAVAFFGLDAGQARHFFQLMDKNGDGDLTLGEFKKALTDMPREVLLQDLRQRVLARHPSIPEAFKELISSDEVSRSRPLNRASFASKLLRWGVDEQEAQALFTLIDQDKSGTISLEELQESLREVAPWISLDDFWSRFAMQWPDIAQCAGEGANARRKGTEKLFALVSPAHRGLTKELPESLTIDAFVDVCMQLDITQSNSMELFKLCATSAEWQCRRVDSDSVCKDCDLDDFFDCLYLWSENPLNRVSEQLTPRGHRRGSASDVAKHLAPVRGVLKALKGQLSSFKPKDELQKD